MFQIHIKEVLIILFSFALWGCAPQKTSTYEDFNIRFSTVRSSGPCDTARSLEVWITQIYAYDDMLHTVRDYFDEYASNRPVISDIAGLLTTTRTDFNRLMPPECASQAYYYANYALHLAAEFLANRSAKTIDDAKLIVYLLDLFLSEQKKIEAQYEEMLEN